MSTNAAAVFEIKTWDEKPYEIEGGSKLNGLRGDRRYIATHADYPKRAVYARLLDRLR